jgi:hypothetical protein
LVNRDLESADRNSSCDEPFDLLAETTVVAAQTVRDGRRNLTKSEIWLPVLDTYRRTMCFAPEPTFRQILEDIRELGFAA